MTAPAPAGVSSTLLARRTLTANSTIAFVLASMVNNLLHESAHAVAGFTQGLTPTISPFSVEYEPAGSSGQQVITAAAGPFFSLVMGFVLLAVARRWGQGFVRLFWMWLSFMALMNFLGYCFIAPFGNVGDTGQVLALSDASPVISVVVGLIGALGILWLARRFAIEVKRYADDLTSERQLAFYPWLIGTPIILVLGAVEIAQLAVPVAVLILLLMYDVAFGIFAPMQFLFRSRVRNTLEPLALERVSVLGLVLTVAVAVFSVIMAGVGGVTLG